MRVLIQRSDKAQVTVSEEVVGKIKQGLVVLVGFTDGDTLDKIKYLAKKVVNLRIFPDEAGIMNKSLLDVKGEILLVSQFTLYANCDKGNRPSYINAMKGEEASKYYDMFTKELQKYVPVATGKFGADMEVSFTNIGPTTIYLER